MSSKEETCSLRVGEAIEVRSEAEILATLDKNGRLEALPFMPEMLKYCGQRFRVFKRVDKACDTIAKDGIRRMKHTVLLDGLRCDGEAHGGCQAACMLLWKEAWLKRVRKESPHDTPLLTIGSAPQRVAVSGSDQKFPCTRETLYGAVCGRKHAAPSEEETFSCQATELRRATSPMAWWDPRQYWRDLRSRNVSIWALTRALVIWIFNRLQHYRGGWKYPGISTPTLTKTPLLDLHLQPGEFVRLLSKDDIVKTLDRRYRNRGLSFDVELVKYCGGIYRVLRRVEKIIDEPTGKVIRMKNPCIVLEGVTCTGDYHRYCPRNTLHYLRETWLRRVEDPSKPAVPPLGCGHTSGAIADGEKALEANGALSRK